MNVHENARLTAHSRADPVRRVLDEGQPRKVVAAAFGVDPKTVGKWVNRFRAEGAAVQNPFPSRRIAANLDSAPAAP